ncbi:MAG: class I tRNA ligase family protein, partial [Cyanobacteria bacterium]|nr:class I tRNA ligase family protein [Cyanobacteriota bacterium]
PHLCEDLWFQLGGGDAGSIHLQSWPVADAQALVSDTVEVVVQVNGKLRDKFQVANGLPKEELEQEARLLAKVVPYLENQQVVKVIVVPNKLVNFVVKP